MLPEVVFKALLGLPIGVMSLAFMLVSVRGLITRRPLVFPARAFVWLFILAVASMSVALISLQFSPYGGGFDFMLGVQLAMFVLLIVVIWRTMQGYVVLGVTEDAFKQALSASLDEAGLTYKESLGGYAIDQLGDVLQASVQGWVGSAMLKMKSRGNREHLERLIGDLRHRLDQLPGRASLFIPITYGLMGLLLLAMGAYLIFEF
jgi:hypothetical protein